MNQKLILPFLLIGILSACTKPNTITFNINANGLTNGVFVVKDQGRQTIFGANVVAGKATTKGVMDEPGFYLLDVVKDGGNPHLPFEVYLEPGQYTITATADNLQQYPKIETDSRYQQEINNYNSIYSKLGSDTELKLASLNRKLTADRNTLSKEAYQKLVISISTLEDKQKELQYNALAEFVTKYPQSELSAHFMAKQTLAENPDKYLALYKQLSPIAKNSADGKDVSKTLNVLVSLQLGKKAPAIAGKTIDGKPYTALTAGKKLFLIDFWRSVNQFSRENHEKIATIYASLAGKGFEIISVSLDKKDLWWRTAVKDDKLPWPQISDLKGDDSPNATNWNITTIPTYYLVDSDWKIYKRDIDLGSVKLEATQYLEKHR